MKKQLLIAALFFASGSLQAQDKLPVKLPGFVDKTFGPGFVNTDIGLTDVILGMALQKDGKIIAAGESAVLTKIGNQTVLKSYFALAKYNPDGSIDSSFGVNGKVLTKFYSNSTDQAKDVAIQADGKIVVAGIGGRFEGNIYSVEIARYNSDGSLDEGFGQQGKVYYTANSSIYVTSLALQKDGGIIIAGTKDDSFAVLRFTTSGKSDQSFGNNGIATADFGSYSIAKSVVAQADNKIVVGGEGPGYALLARFNTNGSLDKSFGEAGLVQSNFGENSSAFTNSIALQPDGKIVAGGNGAILKDGFNTFDFSAFRYKTNGSLDSSFGSNGKQLVDFGDNVSVEYKTLVDKNGKILLVGEYGQSIAITRLKANGKPDSSYGNIRNGKTLIAINKTFRSPAYAAVLQKNGKLVTGGYIQVEPYDTTRLNFSLIRFYGDALALESKTDMVQENNIVNISATPNPVTNNSTVLNYTLSKAQAVSIYLTNMQGTVLKVFINGQTVQPGNHRQQVTLPSGSINGMYNIILVAGTEKKALTIIK